MTNFLEVLRYFFLCFFSLIFFYAIYQLFRNQKVYNIRTKWIDMDMDKRWYKYSYDEMMGPNNKNWYGLKWPNENDYK